MTTGFGMAVSAVIGAGSQEVHGRPPGRREAIREAQGGRLERHLGSGRAGVGLANAFRLRGGARLHSRGGALVREGWELRLTLGTDVVEDPPAPVRSPCRRDRPAGTLAGQLPEAAVWVVTRGRGRVSEPRRRSGSRTHRMTSSFGATRGAFPICFVQAGACDLVAL